ncbi:hypothetical protein R6Q57_013993 [Mikania cordata]
MDSSKNTGSREALLEGVGNGLIEKVTTQHEDDDGCLQVTRIKVLLRTRENLTKERAQNQSNLLFGYL